MNSKKKQHIQKTLKAFSYNVGGVILPFLLSLIGIGIVGDFSAIWKFLDDGQILLFGAGLYTTSRYLFDENSKSIQNDYDKLLNNISFWFLIFCSSFYAILYCLNLLRFEIMESGIYFVRICSFILFGISLISVYRCLYIDFLKVYPTVDIKEESKRGVDNILNQL